MVRISFVILHYLETEDTIECIESIMALKQDGYSIKVHVVDNGSTNLSYEELIKHYRGVDNVLFCKNADNMGFAKGNNIGYRIAKERDNADFIVVLNSDTIITDSLFLEKVDSSYKSLGYYVMGPDLITLNGVHQNPIESNFDANKCKELILNSSIMYALELLGINSLRRMLKKNTSPTEYRNINMEPSCGVALHGAFLVYSPHYISKADFAFYPMTFLYLEENILYYLCQKNGFTTYYDKSISVIHKEDASAKLLNRSDRKRMMFTYKNQLKSAKSFLRLIKEDYSINEINEMCRV